MSQNNPVLANYTYCKQLLDEVEHDIMNYQNPGLLLSDEAEG